MKIREAIAVAFLISLVLALATPIVAIYLLSVSLAPVFSQIVSSMPTFLRTIGLFSILLITVFASYHIGNPYKRNASEAFAGIILYSLLTIVSYFVWMG